MAFHREIAAISGNAIYVALSQAIFEWLAEFHTGLVRLHGAEGLTIEEHKAIFERIAARDPDGAAAAMTAHLTRANEPLPSVRARGRRLTPLRPGGRMV